MSMEKRHVD